MCQQSNARVNWKTKPEVGKLRGILTGRVLVALHVLSLLSLAVLTSPHLAWSQDTIAVETKKLSEKISAVDPAIESTVFDLYLSDKFKGSVLATYTDSWFEIDDPSAAIEQIPDLNKRRSEVLPLLTGRIERERTLQDVGRVFVDLSTFRIIVEPAAKFLQVTSLDLTKRLMAESSGFTLQQNLGLAAIHQSDSQSQSALTHRSFASLGQFFTRVNGTAVQNRPYELTEATAGGIISDYQLRGGLLQSRGQNFSPSLQFAGVQLETAEELFLNDDLARASPLQIFVPSRATVQFYRDGRLLAVSTLDYGLQEIDTSAFPQGSYDVDIIIKETSGRETRDRRFFTKAGFLASRGHPVYTLSAGVIRDRLDVLGTPLLQAGLRFRLLDFLDFGSGFATTNEHRIGNFDLNGLYRGVRFGGGAAVSDQHASGAQGTLGFPILGGAISGRMSRTFGTSDTLLSPTPTPTPASGSPDFIPLRSELRRDLVLVPQQALSVSAVRTFRRLDAKFGVERNKVEADKTRYANGPSLDFRIVESAQDTLTARSAYLATELGSAKSLQLLYRHRLNADWAIDTQILQRWQPANDEALLLVGVTYDSFRGQSGIGTKIQASSEAERHTEPDGKDNSLTTSINADTTSQYLRSVGFARDSRRNGQQADTLGINAESAFLVSDTGEVAVGHPVPSESAFIAEVAGDDSATDVLFDVIVNGQVRETIRAGEHAIVGLAPYRSYKASIQPTEGSAIVNFDNTVHEFSLFPGNVVKHVWKVERTFIILGRLVDENGEPIPHERIRGTKDYTFTEADGSFQAEITGKEPLFIESKRRNCGIDITLESKPDYYRDIGTIACRPRSEMKGQ